MILVDTSVWIDHLHAAEPELVADLESGLVVQHSMIVGELALGSLRDGEVVITLLTALPQLPVADHEEVMALVESEQLHGRGLSLVYAHLLASLRLAPGARVWTRDRRLLAEAGRLGITTRQP